MLGVDGVADFSALHSGKQNAEVQLCAFDVLAMDGADMRALSLWMRKTNLDDFPNNASFRKAAFTF